MSTKTLTATDFVEAVVRRAMLPITQNTLTTDDILAFANEEMDNAIVPFIMQHKEDYYLAHELQATEQSKTRYPIPHRSIGNKLRDVSFVDNNGYVYEMSRVGIGDESTFNTSYSSYAGRYNLQQFFIEGDELVLAISTNTPVQDGNLKMSFYLRPNSFVTVDRSSTITSINRTTGDIVISSLPSNFSTSIQLDLIKAKTPFKTLGYDISINSITTVGLTHTINIDVADIPERLEEGDYVCQAEETPIAQLPIELHSMLTQRVACRCLEALGDQQGLQAAMLKLTDMESKATFIMDDRVEDSPKKARNYHGFLAARRRNSYSRF